MYLTQEQIEHKLDELYEENEWDGDLSKVKFLIRGRKNVHIVESVLSQALGYPVTLQPEGATQPRPATDQPTVPPPPAATR